MRFPLMIHHYGLRAHSFGLMAFTLWYIFHGLRVLASELLLQRT
jgi:hypothetical protein